MEISTIISLILSIKEFFIFIKSNINKKKIKNIEEINKKYKNIEKSLNRIYYNIYGKGKLLAKKGQLALAQGNELGDPLLIRQAWLDIIHGHELTEIVIDLEIIIKNIEEIINIVKKYKIRNIKNIKKLEEYRSKLIQLHAKLDNLRKNPPDMPSKDFHELITKLVKYTTKVPLIEDLQESKTSLTMVRERTP